MERVEPDGAAGWHCSGAAGIREIRLPGLDHARPPCAPAPAAGTIQPGPERAGEVLCGRGAAVAGAVAGRRRGGPLPRRSEQLLRLRSGAHLPQQPDAHLAFTDGDLLDRDRLRRRGAISRPLAACRRATLVRRLDARAVRRLRGGDRSVCWASGWDFRNCSVLGGSGSATRVGSTWNSADCGKSCWWWVCWCGLRC